MANVKLLTFQGGVSQNFRLKPQILRALKNPVDFGIIINSRLIYASAMAGIGCHLCSKRLTSSSLAVLLMRRNTSQRYVKESR